MSRQEWSKAGDGQDRVTTHYGDGSTRVTTERKDGGLTVTDISSSGREVSGNGARGCCGLSDASRLDNKL